jgi:hypothetical protein
VEGGADRAGPRCSERERVRSERFTTLTGGPRGTERERGACARETDTDRLAPPGIGREGERADADWR